MKGKLIQVNMFNVGRTHEITNAQKPTAFGSAIRNAHVGVVAQGMKVLQDRLDSNSRMACWLHIEVLKIIVGSSPKVVEQCCLWVLC